MIKLIASDMDGTLFDQNSRFAEPFELLKSQQTWCSLQALWSSLRYTALAV